MRKCAVNKEPRRPRKDRGDEHRIDAVAPQVEEADATRRPADFRGQRALVGLRRVDDRG